MIAVSPSLKNSAVTMRQLRAFVAVAKTSSISKAARSLNLSSSALSMLVSSLEGEVGTRLFERTTRSLVLTDAGRELLPVVEEVFFNLDTAFEKLRSVSDRRNSHFALATSPLLAATLVPGLLIRFRDLHAGVRVDLWDLPVAEIARAVREGHVDFGVCTADVDLPDLQSTVLYQDRLMLCCLPGHPLALRREVRWGEISGEPMVVLRKGSGLRSLVELGFETVGEALRPAYEVTQVSTAVGLVEAGLAISVLPSYALASTRSTGVLGIPLTAPVIERNIVALTHPNRPLAPPCEAFLRLFQQHMLEL